MNLCQHGSLLKPSRNSRAPRQICCLNPVFRVPHLCDVLWEQVSLLTMYIVSVLSCSNRVHLLATDDNGLGPYVAIVFVLSSMSWFR